MVLHSSSGVQVYIMFHVGTRVYTVDNFVGVLNKHLSLSYEECFQVCFTATTSS